MLQRLPSWMRSSSSLLFLLFLLTLSLSAWQSKHYTGTWKSNGAGGGGKFDINLGTSEADSRVSFAIGSSELKTTVKSFKADGNNFEIAYEFDVAGNRLTSTVKGKREGTKLEASYRTTVTGSDEQVDNGTLTASE